MIRDIAYYIVIILSLTVTTVLTNNKDNVCLYTDKYNVTVEKFYPKNVTLREFVWCKTFPFRCSQIRTIVKNESRIEVEERTHDVERCCPGYEKSPTGAVECHPVCAQECQNGICIGPNVCSCFPGFTGKICQEECPLGSWGLRCSQKCECQNGAHCSPMSGKCTCLSDWSGKLCDIPVPVPTSVPPTEIPASENESTKRDQVTTENSDGTSSSTTTRDPTRLEITTSVPEETTKPIPEQYPNNETSAKEIVPIPQDTTTENVASINKSTESQEEIIPTKIRTESTTEIIFPEMPLEPHEDARSTEKSIPQEEIRPIKEPKQPEDKIRPTTTERLIPSQKKIIPVEPKITPDQNPKEIIPTDKPEESVPRVEIVSTTVPQVPMITETPRKSNLPTDEPIGLVPTEVSIRPPERRRPINHSISPEGMEPTEKFVPVEENTGAPPQEGIRPTESIVPEEKSEESTSIYTSTRSGGIEITQTPVLPNVNKPVDPIVPILEIPTDNTPTERIVPQEISEKPIPVFTSSRPEVVEKTQETVLPDKNIDSIIPILGIIPTETSTTERGIPEEKIKIPSETTKRTTDVPKIDVKSTSNAFSNAEKVTTTSYDSLTPKTNDFLPGKVLIESFNTTKLKSRKKCKSKNKVSQNASEQQPVEDRVEGLDITKGLVDFVDSEIASEEKEIIISSEPTENFDKKLIGNDLNTTLKNHTKILVKKKCSKKNSTITRHLGRVTTESIFSFLPEYTTSYWFENNVEQVKFGKKFSSIKVETILTIIPGVCLTIALIAMIIVLTVRYKARKKVVLKCIEMSKIDRKSIFHYPLPDPPTFQNTNFALEEDNIKNTKKLESLVQDFCTDENDTVDFQYDYPKPTLESFRPSEPSYLEPRKFNGSPVQSTLQTFQQEPEMETKPISVPVYDPVPPARTIFENPKS